MKVRKKQKGKKERRKERKKEIKKERKKTSKLEYLTFFSNFLKVSGTHRVDLAKGYSQGM